MERPSARLNRGTETSASPVFRRGSGVYPSTRTAHAAPLDARKPGHTGASPRPPRKIPNAFVLNGLLNSILKRRAAAERFAATSRGTFRSGGFTPPFSRRRYAAIWRGKLAATPPRQPGTPTRPPVTPRGSPNPDSGFPQVTQYGQKHQYNFRLSPCPPAPVRLAGYCTLGPSGVG